ncbi:MAG: hypothetical protein IIA73_04805 [Proteobacteria bacterium]|nr:hypothetical protein [Pseudomonadota bacterium]
MTADKGDDERLERAKRYPYPAPRHSYLFVNGVAHELAEVGEHPVGDGVVNVADRLAPVAKALRDLGVPGLDERVPVLAYGSNAAPEQLARKYAQLDGDVVIPVLRARLAGYDVVYAPHITGYGAIPATLEVSAATVAGVAVAFLTAPQLALMHDTEIAALNYVYGRLSHLALEFDGLPALDSVYAYLTLHGSLALDGAPTALAAIDARGRRFDSIGTPGMLALARDRVAPGRPLDAFILDNIDDAALRRARTAELRRYARKPKLPAFEVLEG